MCLFKELHRVLDFKDSRNQSHDSDLFEEMDSMVWFPVAFLDNNLFLSAVEDSNPQSLRHESGRLTTTWRKFVEDTLT